MSADRPHKCTVMCKECLEIVFALSNNRPVGLLPPQYDRVLNLNLVAKSEPSLSRSFMRLGHC